MIAAIAASNGGLISLSLVNKRLKNIVQEALVKEVIMPKNSIRKFIQTLSRRPDLAKKVNVVNLGDYQAIGALGSTNLGHVFPACHALVESLNGNGFFSTIIMALVKQRSPIWTISHRFFLDILVALCPNLNSLMLELPPIFPIDPMDTLPSNSALFNQDPVLLFQGPALRVLQNRLRALTITENSRWKGTCMYNINTESLKKLDYLSAPLDVFVSGGVDFAPADPTNPVEVLPSGLKRLQIRACNKHIFDWVTDFEKAYRTQYFPDLNRLDLYFKSCLRSSILLADQGRGQIKAFRASLVNLDALGLTIATYTGEAQILCDVLDELDAWRHLSEQEVWLTAMKQEQFSENVARDPEGMVRRRTEVLEARLFLKNPYISTPLFTSPTFDARAWQKVRFFNGVKGTKWAINNYSAPPKKHGDLVNKEHKAYEKSFTRPVIAFTPSKFEPKIWLEVRFFDALKVDCPRPAKMVPVKVPVRVQNVPSPHARQIRKTASQHSRWDEELARSIRE